MVINIEEFTDFINNIDELVELYLRALPVFAYLCDADKLLFFKYSRRKKCFDLKLGIERNLLSDIKENGFFNYNTRDLFESNFNIKVRKWGSSCNDSIRKFVNSYLSKEVSIIKREEIKPIRFRRLFDEFSLGEEAVLIPFVSMKEIVGFIIVSPVCDDSKIDVYRDIFSCVLDKLLLKKNLDNLDKILSEERKRIKRDEEIYKLGRTAITVAHEMKNTLVGIIGLFDRLSMYLKEDEKAEKYKRIIKEQLNKLYGFSVDINKFSSIIESEKRERVDITEILDNSIEMASAIAENVSFSLSIGEDAGLVYADKNQLEHLFLNLFKNSIEANKKGKVKINISVNREGDSLVVKIKDNSGGVDEETLKNMLKPFYTTKSYGTGLGLAIVKGIVDNYEGEISFRNIPGGLECIIKLPIKEMEDANGKKNYGG